MSFNHVAPVKAKMLCNLIQTLENVLNGDSYEASKQLIAQVKEQAEEIKQDIDNEIARQKEIEIVKVESVTLEEKTKELPSEPAHTESQPVTELTPEPTPEPTETAPAEPV